MKTESKSFTPNSSTVVVSLDDPTINVKALFLQVAINSTTSAEESTGFTDGVNARSKSSLVAGSKKESKRSTTYAITHYQDVSGTVTRKIAGKPAAGAFGTTGEFTLTFDNYASIPIDYMVIGD